MRHSPFVGFHLTLFEQIIAYFETAYPPFNRHKLAQIGNILMNVSRGVHMALMTLSDMWLPQRTALLKKELAAIQQPVLLIHGDKNQIHPIQHAHNMIADLVNAKDGAKMYTIKGISGWDAFVRVAKMVTFVAALPYRWSRIHQRVAVNSVSLQSGVFPVYFASTSRAI
jgi:pimeloyl-ACP methyl ester carboxylesterase